MVFLCERGGNSRRGLSQKLPSQRRLRSAGGRCQKNRAALLQGSGARRRPSPGARLRAPIASTTMKLFAHSTVPPISEREIARRLNMSRNTVHTFLVSESFPERSRRPYPASILDPYKPYILDRWKADCWNGTQLRQASQKARLHRFRRSVSALHHERAQAPPGSGNLSRTFPGCRWGESQWPCRSCFQTLHQTSPVSSTSPPFCTSVRQPSLTTSNGSRWSRSVRLTTISRVLMP